jgi:hypothetical protein
MGLFLSEDACRRLCGWLSIYELESALQLADLKTSGSKAVKTERLVENFIPPHDVLNNVNLTDIRELARRVGCTVYGSKDELIERLIAHFEAGFDVPQPEEAPTPASPEARELAEVDFRELFGALRGNELAEILSHFPELRQSGSKETRVSSLWQAQRSEVSLLATLGNRHLEDILERCELKLGGSKSERVRRLINHFQSEAPPQPERVE